MFKIDSEIVYNYALMGSANASKLYKLTLSDAYSSNPSDNYKDVMIGFNTTLRKMKIDKILSR